MFKSEYRRTTFPNIDTNALFLDTVAVDNINSFDYLIEKHKSTHQIYSCDGDYHCTYLCFMERDEFKHKTWFKLSVSNEDALSEHHTGKLLTRKKQDRLKFSTSPLELFYAHNSDDNDSFDEDDLTER